MLKKHHILLFLILLATTISAQKIEMGTWRTHFAYTDVTQMAAAGDKTYGIADGALLSVDDHDEVRTYSKLTGLSDNSISGIYTISGTGKLLVAYANSNIDIIDPDGYIQNLNDLYLKSMSVSKQINDITYRTGRIYLACGFGIATINLNRLEFGDSYTIGKNGSSNSVLAVKTLGDSLFALTDSSLFIGKLDGTNLMNYQNWSEFPQPEGLNLSMTTFNGLLYLLKNDSTLWQFNNQWTKTDTAIAKIWSDEHCLYLKHSDGLVYDSDGRLWLTNNGTAKIKFIDPDGTWHTLAYSGLASAQTMQDILIDCKKPNRKYVLCPRYTDSSTSLLFVFDDNNTPTDISDDQTRSFTSMVDQDGKVIYFNDKMLRSIAQDKNGTIWIGTTEGTFTIASNAKIFDSSVRCNRVKISRNDGSGLADYLLGTETINAIAIDGGNRKWFATENGVFLVSDDGQKTIQHFTTENSPLLSNSVLSLGIDEASGELFFGTDNGLISYQSDANEGAEDYSEIHAYPNPVRPDYDGVITITGLMEGSHVKICDVNGRTIYETQSNGGIATWDRGDAPSGVYFAMCFDDNKHKGTCKILVLKRQ